MNSVNQAVKDSQNTIGAKISEVGNKIADAANSPTGKKVVAAAKVAAGTAAVAGAGYLASKALRKNDGQAEPSEDAGSKPEDKKPGLFARFRKK